MTAYTPKNLNRWTLPPYYMGAEWPEYFVFLGRTRDSDALARANFDAGLKAIGGELTADDEAETSLVHIVRESHWACGWVEWIAIHETATEQLKTADKIQEALDDYPIVDEETFSQYEADEADEIWRNCYRAKERIEYIRKHRSQFEFRDFRELLHCARGEYFAGYASELIGR